MKRSTAELQAGNERDFLALVQDPGKYVFRLAQIAACAKRSNDRANLLSWYSNAYNSLTVVGRYTHNAEPGFFVRFESLPQWNNRSADNVYLVRFNRWHTRIFIDPPIRELSLV